MTSWVKFYTGSCNGCCLPPSHYNDVIMGTIASQITSLTIVYSTVYSDADQRKHQSSASLAFVRGIHRGPVNSPHRWQVTRKIFPFDDVVRKPLPELKLPYHHQGLRAMSQEDLTISISKTEFKMAFLNHRPPWDHEVVIRIIFGSDIAWPGASTGHIVVKITVK